MATFVQSPENQPIATVTLPGFTVSETAGSYTIATVFGAGVATVAAGDIAITVATLPTMAMTQTAVPSSTILDITTAYLTNFNCPTLIQYPPTGQRGWAAFIPLSS